MSKSRTTLTPADVIEMRRSYAAGGISQRDLCIKYKVTPSTVRNILRGVTWQHLEVGGAESPDVLGTQARQSQDKLVEWLEGRGRPPAADSRPPAGVPASPKGEPRPSLEPLIDPVGFASQGFGTPASPEDLEAIPDFYKSIINRRND